MREDWIRPEPQAPPPAPTLTEQKEPREADPLDDLDGVLSDYERRKQLQARDLIQRALQLEHARIKGAEVLRKHVLSHARDVVGRLRKGGGTECSIRSSSSPIHPTCASISILRSGRWI